MKKTIQAIALAAAVAALLLAALAVGLTIFASSDAPDPVAPTFIEGNAVPAERNYAVDFLIHGWVSNYSGPGPACIRENPGLRSLMYELWDDMKPADEDEVAAWAIASMGASCPDTLATLFTGSDAPAGASADGALP